ncbi:hypothetical protein VCJ71_01650 [Alteriqipengyuania sp. WL0013]|uniref:hypothetical protein n=1 Tax=Alteriqipengyuania sp. WL0013 TaxID=3110773 RepID=UPI002B95DAB3|nr:hypothetical protein [Alteriqipengyuania sp. WL0013]MEB3414762.1 hypothetical protein [Alteriqipengyuania sp. WL0013]
MKPGGKPLVAAGRITSGALGCIACIAFIPLGLLWLTVFSLAMARDAGSPLTEWIIFAWTSFALALAPINAVAGFEACARPSKKLLVWLFSSSAVIAITSPIWWSDWF